MRGKLWSADYLCKSLWYLWIWCKSRQSFNPEKLTVSQCLQSFSSPFLRQIEFPTSCYEIILHEYLESSYLVNQIFDVIFYVQPPRHFCTLGTPRDYRLNIGFTYWDIPKIFKVYEKSRCARDKYKAEVFRTQEHLFGAWQCKQTLFFLFFLKEACCCM